MAKTDFVDDRSLFFGERDFWGKKERKKERKNVFYLDGGLLSLACLVSLARLVVLWEIC